MADVDVQSLADRMVAALFNKPIKKRVDRLKAYNAAEIYLSDIPDDVWQKADAIAEVEELSRRLTQ